MIFGIRPRELSGRSPRPTMTMRPLVLFALGFATFLAPLPVRAQSDPFDGVVVFGDSLSDNGNLSLATGYPQAERFTVNPAHVAVEDVAAHYDITLSPSLTGGTDYAYGGAGFIYNSPAAAPETVKIPAQMDSFFASRSGLDPGSMYVVFGGNNDIFYHATAVIAGQVADQLVAQETAGLPPAAAAALAVQIRSEVAVLADVTGFETQEQALQGVVTSADLEVALINRLGNAGATHILVPNIPDIGRTPEAIAQGPAAQANLTAMATAYNTRLNAGLAGRTDVIPVNLFGLIREVTADPGRYGFSNVTQGACTIHLFACTSSTLAAPDAASSYFFADGMHPTPAGHAALAEAILSEIVAPGQISLLTEAPLALAQAQREIIDGQLTSETRSGSDGVRLLAAGGVGGGNLDGDLYAPASQLNDHTATFGLIARRADLSVGATVGTAGGTTQLGDQSGSYSTNGVLGALFAQYRWAERGWASLQGSGGALNLDDIQRSFMIGAARRTELSATEARIFGFGAEVGRWFVVSGAWIGPFASISYDHAKVDAFREDGNDATAMWFGAQNRAALVSNFGLKLATEKRWRKAVYRPSMTIAYGHDFKSERNSVSAGLVTLNGQFSMPGYAPEANWISVGPRLDVDFSDRLAAFVEFDGRYSNRSNENAGSFGASYRF